jgi:hypothetical protein
MITGKPLKYICAVFNSKLFIFYLNLILSGDNYAYGSKDIFGEIKIPQIPMDQQENINNLVDKRLQKESTDLDNSIDKQIYQIYCLTKEEIEFIDIQQL